ncbi:protein TolR [Rickettsiales endosymbiont of Stachyamoeba lipophora]|uniref:protein TolR n=1 Tax=Rickettsiales endosymbiont of Stachyamoeba lipophora TaxID=2486578 RepID=UPI000F654E41|nr:protein TolR [Rickettsiales endosymbiont of Stachyamoeba lipophora]AZL15436.1 protein TolR [Rickettsiales endosymbiont of Stachyamoeba lipophora]
MGVDTSQQKNKRNNFALASSINVTPFVDVMLVLLIIFMVTSPMLVSGVNVDLPEATDTPIVGDDEPLAVTIDKNSNIFIQDTQIEDGELIPKLLAITKEKKDTRIFVRGDKSVDYGTIMQTVSSINIAGFTKVALITQITNK